VFKPISITPSADGEDYEGRFLFINKGPSPVEVYGFDKPVHGKFELRFVRHQILHKGEWEEIKIGYCGTGAMTFPMQPGKSYEFREFLSDFTEQDTPLTARIRFDVAAEKGWVEYWSYPFVLDWKKDRESGEFAAAKKEHFKKLRAAFAKAGFKEEFLEGDDFCNRIVQSMIKKTSEEEAATSFKPFVGKLDLIPGLELDGRIRIDFGSDKNEYRGWLWLNPRTFNRRWFLDAIEHHVEVIKSDDRIHMELNDGSPWGKSPLTMIMNYDSSDPSKEDSERLFKKMLNVLAGCLKE